MWTRTELKTKAKASLKPFYWFGVLACVIAGLLGAGTSGGFTSASGTAASNAASSNGGGNVGGGTGVAPSFDSSTLMLAATMVVVMLVVLAISLAIGIFLSNLIAVGKIRFFMESASRGGSAGIGRLFFCFGGGHYFNVLKIMFCRYLFEGLWSCLLIIPGIYKHYEYYMVPYLLADNPDMDRKEAFRLSKQLMNGNKFNTWVLELSFLGWYLLGLLLCGIGGIFVNPYYEMTFVELYWSLRDQILGARGNADQSVYTDPNFQV